MKRFLSTLGYTHGVKKECYGCRETSLNQQAHQSPGGCLEGLDSIINWGRDVRGNKADEARTDSPPLDDIEEVNRTPFREFVRGIQIDIPPRYASIPCAICVAYNIREVGTQLFKIAESGTIVCINHLAYSMNSLPSVFTLYENKTHHTSSMRGYTCGCKGCVRNALQYYTEYLKGGGSASYDDACGFIPPTK